MYYEAFTAVKSVTNHLGWGVERIDSHQLDDNDLMELRDLLDKVVEEAQLFFARANEIADQYECDSNGVIK